MTHDTTVHWMGAYQEWRPECICGWVGSYLPRLSDAATEAEQHETNPLPEQPDLDALTK